MNEEEDDEELDYDGEGNDMRNRNVGDNDDDEDIHGVHAHKAVVGPDELLPGEQEPVPKNGEKMVGFTQALMWLPAIFDVSHLLSCIFR